MTYLPTYTRSWSNTPTHKHATNSFAHMDTEHTHADLSRCGNRSLCTVTIVSPSEKSSCYASRKNIITTQHPSGTLSPIYKPKYLVIVLCLWCRGSRGVHFCVERDFSKQDLVSLIALVSKSENIEFKEMLPSAKSDSNNIPSRVQRRVGDRFYKGGIVSLNRIAQGAFLQTLFPRYWQNSRII